MIGPTGPVPNLLRQYELGAVPKEMAEEHDTAELHDGHTEEPAERGRKHSRRWWSRFFRRR
jgi:hypothetical protein